MKGSILVEEAYAAGKMLDHSGWHGVLPRNGTPSDVDMTISTSQIDMAVDNNGVILIVELSTRTDKWHELNTGQRLLYENMVWAGQGNIKAALCHIIPAPEKQIDTVNDVVSFSVMCWKCGELVKSHSFTGNNWKAAVKQLIRFPSAQ